MRVLLRAWSIFLVAAKRLFSQKGLAIATLMGLIVSIALTMSIPLYADAVYFSILREELHDISAAATTGRLTDRSPFTFMFRYIGAWHGPVEAEDLQNIDEYLSGPVVPALGLPQQHYARYFKTDNFRLFPATETNYSDSTDPLSWVSFGFITNLEDQITITEGTFPAPAEPAADSTIDVLISDDLATELGLQVGEAFVTFARQEKEGVVRNVQMPIRVVGVWHATDSTNPAWFYEPAAFNDVLIIPEQTYFGRLAPYMEDEIYTAVWYLVLDGANVHSSDVGRLAARIVGVQQRTNALLPKIGLDISPIDALYNYQRAAGLLTVLLYAFSVPILIWF